MFILNRGKWVYRKWPLRGLLHALSGKWVFSVGARKWLLSYLVNCCFEPSQPLGIISWLKETFIKRYIVERTNKAEIRLGEQSEKTESCPDNLWNEILLKGP